MTRGKNIMMTMGSDFQYEARPPGPYEAHTRPIPEKNAAAWETPRKTG